MLTIELLGKIRRMRVGDKMSERAMNKAAESVYQAIRTDGYAAQCHRYDANL